MTQIAPLVAPQPEPDWAAIEMALPPSSDSALTALRAARRRYHDVKQQLDDLVVYEFRQGTTSRTGSAVKATTGSAAGGKETAEVAMENSKPKNISLPIPHTDLNPRPSRRLRRGSLPQQQQQSSAAAAAVVVSAAPSVTGGGAMHSPDPRAPTAAVAAVGAGVAPSGSTSGLTMPRADTTVPLTYQWRPNLRGKKMKELLLRDGSRFSVHSSSSTRPNGRGGTAVTTTCQGFSLDSSSFFHTEMKMKEMSASAAARDALLVFGLAGTMLATAVKLKWI